MKRIGILTYQFADNYGAVLQCYALCKAINQFKDCNATVINYIPPTFRYATCKGHNQVLIQRKRKLLDTFLSDHCDIEAEKKNIIDYDNYDYICVGSDQIWCTAYKGYFLPDADGIKKITYAASLGYAPESKRLDEKVLKDFVPRFDHVSIRELVHRDYLREICDVNAEVVLDPTLLFDENIYLPIVGKSQQEMKDFVFLFYLPHDDEAFRAVEIANKIARKYNYSIVHSILDAPENMCVNVSHCMMHEGIEDFLYYIKNAKYVITNSYHATLFAMQFEVPFYTTVVKTMRSRVDTLIEKFGIGKRIIEQGIFAQNIDDKIDWNAIKEKMVAERKASYEYLKKALEIVE